MWRSSFDWYIGFEWAFPPPESRMLTAGSGVAGYRIEGVLGTGGMGAIYLAANRCSASAERPSPLIRRDRVESEHRDPARQRLELVGGAVAHHSGALGERYPDRDLAGVHPKYRTCLVSS
jgi:hypothetical protein